MSEELDLEANNLCIPEDAFEKFQAVSMYQEKEYIALPRKVPPKPKPPASVKSCRVSSANEVVSSSGNVMISPVNSTQIESLEEQPLNSSRVESSVGSKKRSKVTGSVHKSRRNSKRNSKYENDTDMVVSNSENVKDEANSTLALPTPTPNVASRKRGRRTKKPIAPMEEMSPETPKTIQNPDISSTPFSSDPENSDTVQGARKKRGRPKRVEQHEDLDMVPPISDKNLSSDLSSSDNNKTAELSTTKPSPATSRRGRPKGVPKKVPIDVSLSPIIQAQPPPIQEEIKDICTVATDIQHEPLNIISNETPKIPKIKAKRSTPKKATSSTVKKVASSTVKKVASSTVKKAESSITKKAESSLVKKVESSPVKKAESSPVKTEEFSPVKKVETSIVKTENIDLDENKVQPDSNNKVLSDNVSDDDMDDVCLSKLKSTPCQSNLGMSTDEVCPLDNKTDENIKDVNLINIDEQLNRTKKKKGRPKKSVHTPNTPTTDLAPVSIPVKVSGDSDADDVSLSKLKENNEEPPMNTEGNDNMEVPTNDNQIKEQFDEPNEINGTPSKRNTKMPVMADFEYNIDSVIENDNTEVKDMEEDLQADPSKRPIRRKAKNMKYQEESDEDPFANVELSDDDEPRRGRRGYKYYSDDEYFPGKRGNEAIESTDTELSDNKEIIADDSKKHKRKKFRKKSETQSPRKRGKKDDDSRSDVASLEAKSRADDTDDFEVCLEPAVIKARDRDTKKSKSSQNWGTTTEFENFLAKKIQGTNLKIKKVSSNLPAETVKIEIPVIDPDAKKTIEMCSQTTPVSTASVSVQTSTPNDVPLIENIPLTPEQSEKACYFLNSIVKTTAELGSLMTQKSEDFIKKKINTTHVVDTAKMDYCVKKSFLLFKLAKHNLLQMEEDLAKQYDEFLETHNLSRCREQPKAVLPSVKESNSDSDCEIVDVEPSPSKPSQKPQAKPAFNPKTVFLNKELSIKIAKKPSEGKKLDIKGRHTVWINDTVMVKKVPKSSQSFLAQDSRNKKPPDNFITNKMVSDFFKDYYRQKALSACAPFISTDWLTVSKECVCNYFVVKPLQFETNANYSDHDGFSMNSNSSNTTVSEPSHSLTDVLTFAKNTVVSSPEPLFTLCFRILKHHLHHDDFKEGTHKKRHELADQKRNPVTLFRLCMRTIIDCTTNKMEICPAPAKHESSSSAIQVTAPTLKVLCHRRIMDLLEDSSFNNTRGEKESYLDINCNSGESSDIWSSNSQEIVLLSENKKNGIKSLFSLCVEFIQKTHIVERNNNSILSPKTLKNIAYENVKYLLYSNDLCETHEEDDTAVEGLMINCVNTLSEEAFLNLEQCNTDMPDSSEYLDDFDNEDSFEPDVPDADDDDDQTEPSWAAQVQMQELRSCVNINSLEAIEQQELEHANEQEELEHANEQEELGHPIGQEELDHTIELEELEHAMGQEVSEHPMGQELLEHGIEQEELGHPMGQEELEHANGQDELEHANEQQELEHANEQLELEHANEQQELEPIITQIKLEPLDDITDTLLDSTQVKTEPGPGPDEMTIIPDVKPEIEDNLHAAPVQRHNSNSYDVDAFEQFVSSNKLMRAFTDRDKEESIYSQNSARIRKQHVPDYYSENDADMLGLLVPHTYETMNIQTAQTAKGSLMESSSDEGYKKANTSKKGTAKRGRPRQRKTEQKPNEKEVLATTPAIPKEKEKSTNNEVAILTRKMKERIRREEKHNESSDSEDDNVNVRLRSRDKKDKIDYTKDKLKAGSKDAIDQATDKSKKLSKETSDDEVRYKLNPALMETCDQSRDKSKSEAKEINDQILEKSKPVTKATSYKTREKSKLAVPDVTEQTPETSTPTSSSKSKNNEIQCNNVDSTDQLEESVETFTGFTSIETNEMSNYEKYMKFVYEKVIPEKENELANDNKEARPKDIEAPVICPNEPVELLECEPTMPFFDDNTEIENIPKKIKVKKIPVAKPSFTDRHGWQCYPINLEDSKLCQDAIINLEKLPESFVQTYFEYQNISSVVDESDQEINRLTNLNTLNRTNLMKERKPTSTIKRETKDAKPDDIPDDDSRTVSAVDSDHYDELLPSDDEGPKVEDEPLQPFQKQSENTIAKNSLMDDKESDDETLIKIKKEPLDNSTANKKPVDNSNENKIRYKPSPLCKKKALLDPEESSELMLTADKMMNKELTLLHAPVVMDQIKSEAPVEGPVTRHHKKSGSKRSPTEKKFKNEEDSSSEEEKQWVSTKEKLLKRMGKKDTESADDAKRAKLVSEFIERREGNPDSRKRRPGGKSRRSGKRFLEREKQLRVLQRELFGEMSNDPTVSKRSVAAWKGRRNIRKVLDKKSLARSTVIANMEEFERKKRLNARQTKLRELLGCEEGVNVLVINDEVCLEYDFEEHRPVVTIHPFFTKVMKAHQYEGVKFMWDACFESLADMEAGHAGGGCILAHCMGLGKTLQVLALLHTVLTHPRVGMHRVLVCCPLSTVLNWVDEIHKWIGPVTNQIKVFELSKLKKTYERAYQLEDWYNGGGIFIIGYELFRSLSTLDPLLDDVRPTIVNKIRTALLDPGPDIIVCDEGHLLKNDCSVLAVAMSRVVTKRRIILTGTPMQNNLREYYCMVNFVKPNLLGTYSEYSNRFENPIMNGQHRDSSEEDIKLMKARTHILHKVLEGCLQRQEASVLYPYLPKKHEYTVFINLTKCQWDLYKHYLNHYSRQMKQNSILKDFHILQKIWSHPQVLHNFQTKSQENRNKLKLEKLEDDLATEDQEDIKDNVATELWWLQYLDGGNMLDALDSSNKFVVVFRILDECVALGDKVLIFSTSLFCLDALEYFLKKINKWSLGQEYYRLDGSVPAEVRQKWCREFNADNNVNTKLFLVSTRAGCLGLNMTSANRVIIMDTSWNPAHDIQSIFRVYRFGQKKDCYIYRLVAMGTMEQKIYERSVTKQAVACRVVDEQQIDRHYNMAELTELYRYDEAGASVAGGVAVGVVDVALLRVARDVALHAVHEHDSLLRSSEQGLPEHERNAAWMQFQQEQAHKQMENKLIANIPKLSLKRIHGNAYAAKSIHVEDIKPEIKVEEPSDDFVAPPPNKPKRGRPPKIKDIYTIVNKEECAIAPKPTPEHFDPEMPGTSAMTGEHGAIKHYEEEMMVQKITEILIQHDFHNRKRNTEIADLVGKVRKIVKQGYIYKTSKTDTLTTSIAKVLLKKRMSLPALTDIMCESINKSGTPQPREEPENILSTPSEECTVKEEHVPESRRKRKAALAAERHIDSISQDVVISLDDDFDTSDTEFIPNIVERPERPISKRKNSKEVTYQKAEKEVVKTNPRPETSKERNNTPIQDDDEVTFKKASPKTRPSILKSKVGPKAFKEKLQKKYKQLTQKMDVPVVEAPRSILLSDDEEMDKNSPLATNKKKPVAKSNPPPNVPDIRSPEVAIEPEDEEVIPLPLSLLTNKNFINIVAHTYLNGNPMLDADAATLAAQYSTFKSLKEAEQTGRDIVSGPIYDIALKVIGKALFKKMNSNNIKPIPVETANVTIELKQKMDNATDKKSKEETKSKKRRDKKAEKADSLKNSILEAALSANPNGNVVPVGFIQTTASLPSEEFASESILPDDDDGDMHIVPHDLPPQPRHTPAPTTVAPTLSPTPCITISTSPTPQTPSPPPTNPTVYNVTLKQTPDTPSTSTPPPSKQVIKINRGKIIHPTSVVSGNSSQAKPPPTQHILPTEDTICLDSDDEDVITTTPAPTPTTSQPAPANIVPVPVSLTAGHPSEIILSAPLNTTAVPLTPGATPKPLILRQVAAGAAPKFVLVPAVAASSLRPVPSEYLKNLPKLLPKEPAPTQSTPLKTVTTPPVQSPEIILSTDSPPLAGVNKIKQARCRPGDIIKISDKGEIEVLQVGKLSTVPKPPVSEIKAKLASEVPKPKPAAEVPKPKPAAEVTKPKPVAEVEKPKPTPETSKPKTTYGRNKSKPTVEAANPKPSHNEVPKAISLIEPTKAIPLPPPDPKPIITPKAASTPKPVSTPKPISTPKPASTDIVKESPVKKPPETITSKTRSVSISSSSSDDSRPSTPDNNPLSILKNVVHIQAADDNVGTSSDRTKSKPKSGNCAYIEHVYSSDHKVVTPKKQTKETLVKTTPRKDSVKIMKDMTKTTKLKSDASAASSSINSAKIDTPNKMLTDLLNKKTNLSIKPAMLDKKSSLVDKKAGGSLSGLKAIVVDNKSISSNNKSFKTVDLTQITSVKSGSGATILKTKIEAKKRVAPVEIVTTKKKKTAPMTLKDFNIDDIDDIIELD